MAMIASGFIADLPHLFLYLFHSTHQHLALLLPLLSKAIVMMVFLFMASTS